MKKTILKTKLLSALLCALLIFSLGACTAKAPDDNQSSASASTVASVWDNALYSKDTTLGEGSKTVTVYVVIDDQKLTFTLKTDGATLGDALVDTKLVEGEQGDYGLFITHVNGIRADYNLDGAYWSINQNGEALMTGADSTNISGGESFELVYTKT